VWKGFSSPGPGMVRARSFAASRGNSRSIGRYFVTTRNAWKHFIHKHILRIAVKYTKRSRNW